MTPSVGGGADFFWNNPFTDFKDVVSELALHAESKMIIFVSGSLQGFS